MAQSHLSRTRHGTPQEIVDRLSAEALAFGGDALADDLTMLALRRVDSRSNGSRPEGTPQSAATL